MSDLPEKQKRSRPDRAKEMGLKTDAGDNTRYLMHNMGVLDLAESEIDMTSTEEVGGRIRAYFELCAVNDMKPSVAGFALAFGVDRTTIWRWINGEIRSIPEEVRKTLKRAHNLLNAQMEDYMQNGKINPVAGIFLMKNNMGYEDKKEITLAPANPLGEETPPEDLRRKYLEAIESPEDAEGTEK